MASGIARSAFLAGSAAVGTSSRLRAAELPVIRVGMIPADVNAVVAYAADLGYFKDAGLDVEVTLMNSGPVIATAVIGGTLDVGAANITSIAAARERGFLLRLFAPAAIGLPTTATDPIMVRKDSTVTDAADLDGKTIALVALKTTQHAALLRWLDKHGADSKSIKLIEVPFPEMIEALDAGRVDAVLPAEPFASQARPTHRLIGNVYASMPPILSYGFFATDGWLAANADLAVKFAGVIRKSAIWANAHNKESAVMLTRLSKMDLQVTTSMNRAVYATSLDVAQLQPVLDISAHYGILAKSFDAHELIWQPPAK